MTAANNTIRYMLKAAMPELVNKITDLVWGVSKLFLISGAAESNAITKYPIKANPESGMSIPGMVE